MKVIILGASTGNGHKSVMGAISSRFVDKGVVVENYPTFYEDLCESNQVLSDFYNMAQERSIELGVMLNEIMILEGQERRKKQYAQICAALRSFFLRHQCDVIISVSSLINYHIITFFEENNIGFNPSFYIVVTDPYRPMYPGFDVTGAKHYFCPTVIAKQQLQEAGIEENNITVTGYPVSSAYFQREETCCQSRRSKLHINEQFIIMINCGVAGSMSFYSLATRLIVQNPHIHFLVLCGKNKTLYTLLDTNLSSKMTNYTLFSFTDKMPELYSISDYCITKPGANSVFETLITRTIPLIYSFGGMLFQEKGVFDFLNEQYDFNLIFSNEDELCQYIHNEIDSNEIRKQKNILEKHNHYDAANEIAKTVLCLENGA